MEGKPPKERFPEIGTLENPALFYDGSDLLLCYEIALSSDGGNAILQFSDVTYFEKNPNTVEGLGASPYPVRPWEFTEVFGSDRTERWTALKRRFWTISFNDISVEVVFSGVQKVHEPRDAALPGEALLEFLRSL